MCDKNLESELIGCQIWLELEKGTSPEDLRSPDCPMKSQFFVPNVRFHVELLEKHKWRMD